MIEEKGKELILLIDCTARWNSLLTMTERFIFLQKPINKALIDISSAERINPMEL